MNHKLSVALIVLLMPFYLVFPKNQNIARLGILDILNNTKSKNYDYIKNSLTTPIVKKIGENFVFERPNAKTIQEYGDRFFWNCFKFIKQ